MNKLIVFLSVVSFLLFTSEIKAAETNEHIAVTVIDEIYYNSDLHIYEAHTTPDDSIGFWTLDLEQSDTMDADLKQLTNDYRGVTVRIIYTGNLDTDNDIEIISAHIETDAE